MSFFKKFKSLFTTQHTMQSTDIAFTSRYTDDGNLVGHEPWPRPSSSRVSNITPDFKATHDYIQEGFEKFHAENPEVYKKLTELALVTKANGHKQIGISLIWERMRWFYTVETTGDQFKLNNNYRAPYARLLMDTVPALKGFFKTRKQWAEE